MSFQKCPLCEGVGDIVKFGTYAVCGICKGKKIINEATGLPPEELPQIEAANPDAKAEELLTPMEDLTEQEVLYWSTPYYDEIQAEKEAHEKAIKENPERNPSV